MKTNVKDWVYFFKNNKEYIGVIIGRKIDPAFVVVKYIFSDKGRNSHDEVLHVGCISKILSEQDYDILGLKTVSEFKRTYPEEFL